MKKLLAFVLALALVLTIVGCGKKEEPTTEAPTTAAPTTEAPTTPAPTTPAPTTEAPTTPAPTTEAPTTEAPTTEAPTTEAPTTEAPPADLSAQEVVDAALNNLEAVFRSLGDESQATQLTFRGGGEAGLTITIAMGEQKMDIPVKASASAEGVLDSVKGAHALAEYEADLGMLAMMLGDGSDNGDEPLKGTVEAYVDFATQKVYENTDGNWYFSESGDLEFPMDEDEHLAGKLVLDDLFESYDFGTVGDHYLIEGKLKMELPEGEEGMEGLLPEEIAAIGQTLPLDQLAATCRITVSKDLQFTGMKVEMGEVSMDLSSVMEGFAVKLDGIQLEIALNWGEGSYELPKEVEESAVEKPEEVDPFEEDGYPWAATEFTLENELLTDTEDVALTVEKIEVADFGEVEVHFAPENKTDKNLTYVFDDIAVNGFVTNAFCMETVNKDSTDGFNLSVYSTDLKMIGAESIDQISFNLKVRDADDYFADPILEDSFTIYPTGTDPEAYELPERRVGENEVTVLDNEDVLAVIVEGKAEKYFGYEIVFYFENRTDKDLEFSFENVKLNGTEIEDPYWSFDMPAGGRGFAYDSIYESVLEELKIEKLESIEATLNVEPDDFFSDEVLYTADVVFEVK